MRTAYAYARFSSDNQREESITAQLRAIREYCAKNDIVILKEYRDEAFSARTDKRPQFQEMFARIKEHPADVLIVHKLDRFARNRADAAFYRRLLKDAGMTLVSVLERLDDSPESIIMEGLLDSLNEYYSANLSRETKKGLRENVLSGRRNGGKPPIGYECVNQHLVPNKDAEKVTHIFDMYALGKSYKEMMEYSGWPHNSIANMLQNEVYLGTIVFGESRCENAHTPLVKKDVWDACRRRMSQANGNASNRAKHDYMLARMLICQKCGKPMIGVCCDGRLYYTCRTKGCKWYRKEDLEDRVQKELSNKLKPTDEMRDRFYSLVMNRVSNKSKLKEVEKANADIEKRVKKILNAVQYADEDSVPYLMSQVKELKQKMMPIPKERQVSRDACDAFIDSFFDFSDKSYDERKMIIRKVLCKIVVGEELYLTTNIQGEVYGFVLR